MQKYIDRVIIIDISIKTPINKSSQLEGTGKMLSNLLTIDLNTNDTGIIFK